MSWRDRYCEIRDRWLTNPNFQRWASNFPLTRPTARRRARALFDVCAGFVYSQILYACVRLKLFELLAAEPLDSAAISAALNVPLEGTERLLEAAVSLRLIERRAQGRYGLGQLGAALVGNPSVTAMILHHRLLYADLKDPVALLKGRPESGHLAQYWAYDRAGAQDEAHRGSCSEPLPDYTELMADSQALVAEQTLDAYPLKRHGCLMDVGGGDGSFVVAAAKRHPSLKYMLFDLPPVAARAQERFAAAGLAASTSAIGGDFITDALPQGADVISLIRVLHDHDDEPVGQLLKHVFDALAPQGTVLIAEPMLETTGAEPVGSAYFGFYLLAMGSGKARTPRALKCLLAAAGFRQPRMLFTRQPLQCRVMVARKPPAPSSVPVS
jgi:demethylspheroidene O-methyltransferase